MMNSKYNFFKLYCCTFLLVVAGLTTVKAQKTMSDVPMFGAQIFI